MRRPSEQPPPSFRVGPIPIYGRRILAPMDGVSDLPYRTLCRSFGSAMSYTPFVAAGDILGGPPRSLEPLKFESAERPVAFQIFDDNESRLREAALRLVDLGPDLLDINMGCSARCVAGRGAGAGLLRDPRKIGRILSALSQALPIPVTAKIRLGWDDASRNYLEVARIIAESGGQLLAVHGRTKQQGYSGQADWDPIGEIKASVPIPVVGNGDVRSPADAARLLETTGCDAVMIGRGAIGNPWIFAEGVSEPTRSEILDVVLRHLGAMQAFYGASRGSILFRKHLSRYLDRLGLEPPTRRRLLTEPDPEALRARIEALRPEVGASADAPLMSNPLRARPGATAFPSRL